MRAHHDYALRKQADGFAGIKHGHGGYSLGCRCEVCRTANNAKCAAWKARRRQRQQGSVGQLQLEDALTSELNDLADNSRLEQLVDRLAAS